MPTINTSVSKDYIDMYNGYDQTKVGAGLINPDIYATPAYTKKKIKNLVIGGITDVVYSGFDVDPNPMCLPMAYEPRYNTIIALNLNYVPSNIRKSIMKFILDSNAARIRSNQPLMVNYDSLSRAIPQVKGIVRRYKVVAIRPIETYQLNEWVELIKRRSRYENVYKEGMR
tara:strand:+ start:245 stop:757 length:513 start_codon:yes stop_codon:yes gene_type:complete